MAIDAGGALVMEAVNPATGIGVFESRIPIGGGMTLCAGRSELTGMRRRLGMAGNTIGWRAFENVICVTPGASQSAMGAGQREWDRKAKFIVWKMSRIDDCSCSSRSAVIRVTGPARTAYPALK
jgi:hypothetical protein